MPKDLEGCRWMAEVDGWQNTWKEPGSARPQPTAGGRRVALFSPGALFISPYPAQTPAFPSTPEPQVMEPKELGCISWSQGQVRSGWPMVALCGAWSPSPCAGRSSLLQSDGKLAKVKKRGEKSDTGESPPKEKRCRLPRCA